MSAEERAPAAAARESRLHARNRHRGGYDIERLAAGFPPLNRYVVAGRGGSGTRSRTVDFSRPEAVGALNAALLSVDYHVRGFALPDGRLCPAVPGRADYVHVLADLLADETADGRVPRGADVVGLDIGVGASCVYPLLGHAEYGWSFVGSDVDRAALASAEQVVSANDAPVRLVHQPHAEHVLAGALPGGGSALTFTMCNPPFYASAAEAAAATARKWKGVRKRRGADRSARSFGGNQSELWCAGGERRFISAHIRESALHPSAALWFTSLVSAESSLPKLLAELRSTDARRVERLGVATGNKQMRILAWSYWSDAERRARLAELTLP